MKKPLIQKLGLLGLVSLLHTRRRWYSRISPLRLDGAGSQQPSAADAPSLEMKIVQAEYFGVVERFSVFAATGFNAALAYIFSV